MNAPRTWPNEVDGARRRCPWDAVRIGHARQRSDGHRDGIETVAEKAAGEDQHGGLLWVVDKRRGAAHLIGAAFDARCALLPMVLREPANAALGSHPAVAPVFATVLGG